VILGAIVPWNCPFHNVLNPVLSAVFAGNAAVIKVSFGERYRETEGPREGEKVATSYRGDRSHSAVELPLSQRAQPRAVCSLCWQCCRHQAIVPWNYPFHNVLNPVLSAVFAGNAA
ncbi:unnamed protein product, partial [Closterium sp. NIES-53]